MTDTSDHWYVRIQFGIELGPMPRSDLDELAETGQLLIGDSVREGANGEWFPARDLPGLSPPNDLITEGDTSAEPRPTEPPADDSSSEPAPDFEAAELTENDQDSPEPVVLESNRVDESAGGLPGAQSLDEFDFDTGPSAVKEDVSDDSPSGTSPPLAGTALDERTPALPEDVPSVERNTAKQTLPDFPDSVETQEEKSAEESEAADTEPAALPDPLTPSADGGPFPDFSEDEDVEFAEQSSELPDPLAPVASREPFPDSPDEDGTDPAEPTNLPPAIAIPYATDLGSLPSTEQSARSLPPIRLPVPRMASLIRLAIAVAVIVGLWKLIGGGGPEPDIYDEYSAMYYIYAEYSAIYSELQDRRNNPADSTGWMSFAEQARAQIDEYNVWVEESAEPGDREKNLLLEAGRDMQELLSAAPDAESPHEERLDGFFRQLSEIYADAL